MLGGGLIPGSGSKPEPFQYRARKWAVQRVSRNWYPETQAERLQGDYDVLLVLDACRYDTLRDVTDWPIESCYSLASATPGWLREVDRRGLFADKTVVSANTQYTKVDVRTKETHMVDDSHWDERLGNVPPEAVLDAVDDRIESGTPIVGHVLPPHAPYVGRVGGTWIPLLPDVDAWTDGLSPQETLATGRVDLDRAARAYRQSVASTWNTVLNYVSDWLDRGLKVAVTADHGEAFGRLHELGFVAHPSGCRIRPLVQVPWVVFDPGEADIAGESPEERLVALGYKDA